MNAPRVLPPAVAAAAFLVLLIGRSNPWQLALLAATAIGALVYVTLRTLQNMRELTTRPGTAASLTRASPRDRESRSEPPPAADESNPGEPSR